MTYKVLSNICLWRCQTFRKDYQTSTRPLELNDKNQWLIPSCMNWMCSSPILWKVVPLLCQFKADCHNAKLPSDLKMHFYAESIELSFNHVLSLKGISLSDYFKWKSLFFIHVATSVTIFWSWLSSVTIITCGCICFLQCTRSINH